MNVTTIINLDIKNPGMPSRITAMQNDVNTWIVKINLYSGGAPWSIPEGVSAAVGFRKCDGTKGLYDTLPDGTDALAISEATITAILAPQVLTTSGVVEAVIVFNDERLNQLSTPPFCIYVQENPSNGCVKSEDYYNYTSWEDLNNAADAWFTEQNVKINEAIGAANDMAAAAAGNANAAAAETLAAKDSFLDTAGAAMEQIRSIADDGTDAPPIVCSESGSVIALQDSGKKLLQGLKVFGKTTQKTTTGKNLFVCRTDSVVISGVSVTPNGDGSFVLNGTASADTSQKISDSISLPAGKYTIMVRGINKINNDYDRLYVRANDAIIQNYIFADSPRTFTLSEASIVDVSLILGAGTSYSNKVVKFQIEAGETATEWEPYTGGIPAPNPDYPQDLESVGDVNVTVAGKNLLRNTAVTQTKNGVTFTVHTDGSVTVNGTATATTFLNMDFTESTLTPGESYIAGILDASGYGVTMGVSYYTADGSDKMIKSVTTPTKIIVPDDYVRNRIYLQINSGATVNNLTIYPMIRHESITDSEYEPYKANQTLPISTPNGLPGIPVTSDGNYTDENGQMWVCDEVDFGRGVYVQRVSKYTFTGNEQWENSGTYFYMNAAGHSIAGGCLCTHFPGRTGQPVFANGDKIAVGGPGWMVFVIEGALAANYTVDTFKAFCAEQYVSDSPVELHYITETIETPLSAEELAAYAALHTNYPNTTIFNDGGANMEVKYVADTKLYIDKKFAELAAAIVSST